MRLKPVRRESAPAVIPTPRLLLAGILAPALLLGAADAAAAVVPWLYDVEVPVASQSDAERRRAARAALAELLTRLTGLEHLPEHPEVRAALDRPEAYYAYYRFANRPAADAARGAVFQVSFQPNALIALLRRADLPLWAADRPTLIAWVAVQPRAGPRRLAADGDALGIRLKAAARRRGLTLAAPLLDLADRRVDAFDVWGGFSAPLARASARYAPDLLLRGRIAEDARGGWSSDWQLLDAGGGAQGQPARFSLSGATPDALAERALGRIAAALAGRYAVRGALDAIDIAVRGAGTVAAYAALLDYLHSREYIERFEVRAVTDAALTLRLHARSGRARLAELLAMGDELDADPEAGPSTLVWRGGG